MVELVSLVGDGHVDQLAPVGGERDERSNPRKQLAVDGNRESGRHLLVRGQRVSGADGNDRGQERDPGDGPRHHGSRGERMPRLGLESAVHGKPHIADVADAPFRIFLQAATQVCSQRRGKIRGQRFPLRLGTQYTAASVSDTSSPAKARCLVNIS